MLSLGLPVPASSAKMPVCDPILTAFPQKSTEGVKSGRLEQECAEMALLISKCGKNSLVLADEVFSSTSAADGVLIAENSLRKLCKAGCRCVFSTHLHSLCGRMDTLNSDGEGSRVDLLAAETRGRERTFQITRGKSANTSDAITIADKYGLINHIN